ncbi:unnamed protein product [Lymnaea stagnalis]|uniref:Major facilitator superfamily (MFS) profile domain-containing protein n=1 Tax=Lymnaea stagnalis TaxID=6523 RepID=A0AAV2HDS3_LYMST
MGGGKYAPVDKKREDGRLLSGKDGDTGATTKSTEADDYVTPPDGGWGWMVVFSSFLIHVIADGVVYSFGVFLMEFVDYFHAGRGATSWVGSLQPAVTFTVGPLSSALTNRYGCRPVTIAGAIIAAAGFILSMWAPNLYYLYFTSGIMAGVGFGLIYLPAIVCVAQYFEKRRSFATGLAVCGSGFGTFILAPITEMLVHEYKWQGAMLILGGVILNVVACGIIFRPLERPFPTSEREISEMESENLLPDFTDSFSEGPKGSVAVEEIEFFLDKNFVQTNQAGAGNAGEGVLSPADGLEIIANLQQQHALPEGTPHLIHQNNAAPSPSFQKHSSLPNSPSVLKEDGNKSESNNLQITTTHPGSPATLSLPVGTVFFNKYGETNGVSGDSKNNKAAHLSVSQCISVPDGQRLSVNQVALACSDGALNRHNDRPKNHHPQGGGTILKQRHHRNSESSAPATLAPLSRKDIFYSGSLLNIPMYRSHPDVYKATVTSVSDRPISLSETESFSKKGGLGDIMNEFRQTMKDMLSLSLLKNPVFLMFGISNFFTSIGFNMPFIFLPDRAKLAGIDADKAALLLSVIGIANTAGRVIFGFLSDRSWVNRLMLYNTALTICGVATAFSPIVGGDYGLLVAYAAIFGVFIGVYVSLTSVVLVDLLGLEYLTNSFGLLLLFQGAATFVGPPIAGWMCDWTGSYDISFIVMGILIALSGCMLFFLPCVQRYAERRAPKINRIRDIELGKQPVSDDAENTLSLEQFTTSQA